MEATPEGAWRSFFAAFVCLPAFLALRFFGWADHGLPSGGLWRSLAAELIGYATAWVAFALLSLPLVQSWGRAALWPRFLAAWNWSNVIQYLVALALTAPGFLGLPAWAAQGLTLAGFGYVLWLEWFVARVSLGVEPGRAVALVALDLAIDLAIMLLLGRLIQRLSLG